MNQDKLQSIAGMSDTLADAVELAARYTVRVDGRGRLAASGIVWTDGVILAASHSIERDEDIAVTLPDGNSVAATIAGRDPGSDLAILRVEPTGTPAPHSDHVRVGMLALAVGRPGHSGVGASIGIVSAIGAPWRSRRRGMTEGLIRPDLTMYPGFSGGPLVDIAGRMIGMNTSGMGGNGLTIPVAVANPIVEQILTYGRIRRGYLGLTSQPVALPESIATTAGQETGLLVIGVESDSPAADAGVMVGDILIGIDGHPMRDTDDLREALSSERAGQSASLRIIRGGDIRELDTTIGER